MAETPTVLAVGHVRDEVVRLPGNRERLLQSVVVVRRDGEWVGDPGAARPRGGSLPAAAVSRHAGPVSETRRKRREERVQIVRPVLAAEDLVELAVERERAEHDVDELRDAQELERLALR